MIPLLNVLEIPDFAEKFDVNDWDAYAQVFSAID